MADTYRIVAQTLQSARATDGSIVDVYEITFQSVNNATIDRIRVPQAEYTPENVDRIIRERVERIDAIHNL
jgi:hypothetical protein